MYRGSLPQLKTELRSKQLALTTIRSAPSTDALRETVSKLLIQKAEMEQRLTVLKSGNVKPVDARERERIEMEHRKWRGVRERRKRAFSEVEGMILDSGVVGRSELWVSDPMVIEWEGDGKDVLTVRCE